MAKERIDKTNVAAGKTPAETSQGDELEKLIVTINLTASDIGSLELVKGNDEIDALIDTICAAANKISTLAQGPE